MSSIKTSVRALIAFASANTPRSCGWRNRTLTKKNASEIICRHEFSKPDQAMVRKRSIAPLRLDFGPGTPMLPIMIDPAQIAKSVYVVVGDR